MTREEMIKELGMTMPEEGRRRKERAMVYLSLTKDGKTTSTFRVPVSEVKDFVAERQKEGWRYPEH